MSLASTLRDTRLIFRRQLRLSLRNPAWLIIGVIQPILYLALFGPLVKHFVSAPGASSDQAWRIFVPGLLVQLGLFGSLFVGFAIIAEWRAGVIERMRVTPVSRFALLFGRVLRDMIALLVQSTILVLTGLIMGLRAPVGGVLFALAFIAVLAISMSSLSYAVGLALKSEDSLAPLLNSVAVPVLLLSGILLPITRQSAPSWLYYLSRINPFRYIVDAMREVFLGTYADLTVLWGTLISLGLAVVCIMLGVRRFQIDSA
ncbi:ABC transporter permease [Actinocrinis sp.]|jgi:ABC-2 type transport system permease protein|uniref:ABC transporter permease n=1 Tax=Actinocrinis sp. TaxID=1920516 RepID=UPI002B63A815|nr:ABC transporter permease [Actinocrinis sp.]HXR71433.1 ABC transporter permease [Actinocrinis sp.]